MTFGGRAHPLRDAARASGPLARRAPRRTDALDGAVIAAVALLVSIGIVMIYSTTAPMAPGHSIPPHFWRHASVVVAGALCAALVIRVPARFWQRTAFPLWFAAVGLLLATAVVGTEINGAQRWLVIPGVGLSFQPGEIAKWATLLAIAALLARREVRGQISRRQLLLSGVLAAVPVALLLAQPDLGNALLLSALVGLMLFAAQTPLRHLAVPAAVVVVGAAGFVAFHRYALDRLLGFLDPWQSPTGDGFQLVQSFVAFGRGGALGVGLGDGRQKLFYLPEAHTDFILAVIAEEVGLVGVLAVLTAFTVLLVAGFRIVRSTRDQFGLLLAFGMTTLLSVPAAINAAVVMGVVPTKGLTLPLVSYGRTSLMVYAIAVGQLLAIARFDAAPRRVRRAEPRGFFAR